jgi:hypothetical protein
MSEQEQQEEQQVDGGRPGLGGNAAARLSREGAADEYTVVPAVLPYTYGCTAVVQKSNPGM